MIIFVGRDECGVCDKIVGLDGVVFQWVIVYGLFCCWCQFYVMVFVELFVDVFISLQDMWDYVLELLELGEWFVIYEGWCSELFD